MTLIHVDVHEKLFDLFPRTLQDLQEVEPVEEKYTGNIPRCIIALSRGDDIFNVVSRKRVRRGADIYQSIHDVPVNS